MKEQDSCEITCVDNEKTTRIQVHVLHVWGMSTTEPAFTVHLVRSDKTDKD